MTAVLAVLVPSGTALGGPPSDAQAGRASDDGVVVTTTRGEASCSRARVAGGEWPSLNGGLDNARHQREEEGLDVLAAARLEPAWTFDLGSVGATGGVRSTPVTQDGCVYVATGEGYLGARGDVVALNADTGALVWHARVDGSLLGLAVADGLVLATPSSGTKGDVETPTVTEGYRPHGSHAIALDAGTGRLRWVSERLDDGTALNGTFVNASPVVFSSRGRSLVFVPLSGGGGDGARVPMYFLDAHSGGTVLRALSLTEAEYGEGYGGTGIWSTAAYDPGTGHLYAGTADSDGKTRQHRYNNAVLKIDGDLSRPTFGTVVDAYEGISERADVDRHVAGFGDTPLCSTSSPVGSDLPTFFDTSAALECLELDLDFGASPQLHPGPDGLRVAVLQKAGVLHDVDTATMDGRWRAVIGPGGAFMSAATGAVGDGSLYVGGTPNLLQAVDPGNGLPRWASQTGLDAFAYQPLTLAAGVLYTITDTGQLVGVHAATGVPVLHRSIARDLGRDPAGCLGAGAGVAVARGTVYVPCDGGGQSDLAGSTDRTGRPPTAGALVAYR